MSNLALIIEPCAAFKKYFKKIFEDELTIQFFESISQVENHDIKREPDVILLDVDYRRLDVYSSIKAIKSHFRHDIPLIILVDVNSIDIEREVRETGVFSYLTKPVNFCELEQIVFAALQYSLRRKISIQNQAKNF